MAEYEVIIIGGGPAGLSAGIYSVRHGLKTLVIEGKIGGGLTAEAPWIENYLGFEGIIGMELTNKFKAHASKYVKINELETVKNIERDQEFIITTDKNKYQSTALIIATGTTHAKLGVKGEDDFLGKGISYCATCDGFFFKGKKVLVIGGGNTAIIDAIHLNDIGCKVTLIHRRNELRAEQSLQKRLFDRGIKVIWNSVVEEIKGDKTVTRVSIRTPPADKIKELEFHGVFVSIGEIPQSQIVKGIGVSLDEQNYIVTDKRQCTNIPKVYGAGDVTGGVKQIITACAEGAIAATSAYEDIKNPYWVKEANQ